MKRHAYLIMAHNQYEILIKLIKLLDHENNTFYIHIDKKSKNIPWKAIEEAVCESKIIFIERISVNWGGYSQIQCILNLLKAAVKGNYDYYHLLSGVDMPLKNKYEILNYFEEHDGVEYVHFERETIQEKYLDRIKTYYFFQERAKNNKLFELLGRILKKIEIHLGVNRLKRVNQQIQFGASWFSITHSLVQYVLKQEQWIHDTFKYGFCVDELYLQSIIINSEYKEKLVENAFSGEYTSCLRHIDWKRGNPYVFRESDFQELIGSPCLFARKFDLNIDRAIVNKLYAYLQQ